jgi:hypothetical protein
LATTNWQIKRRRFWAFGGPPPRACGWLRIVGGFGHPQALGGGLTTPNQVLMSWIHHLMNNNPVSKKKKKTFLQKRKRIKKKKKKNNNAVRIDSNSLKFLRKF